LFIARYLDQRAAEQARAAQGVVRTAEIRRGALQQTIRIEGATNATRGVIVTTPRLQMPESGREMAILSLPLAGARVREGDLVVELDSQSLRDHIDDVRDMVQDRENNLTKRQVELELASENLEQRLRVAQAQLDKARLDLRTLEVRSVIRQQVMRLAAEEAEANLERLNSERTILAESHRANLRGVEIQRDLELMHINRHIKDLARYKIYSPMDGLAILSTMRQRGGDEVTIAVGDQVRPGQPIVRVVDTSSLELEAPVNQTDAARFDVGQLATVGFDAYPGIVFRGRVASIGAIASMPGRREQFYVRTVPVRLQLLDHDDRILPDMTAWADVVVESEDDALIAPASAVEEQDGKHYVHVESSRGFERREVRLGAMSHTEVALVEGVSGRRARAGPLGRRLLSFQTPEWTMKRLPLEAAMAMTAGG
jgi:HlyD family secretion protein